ncbi:hypothetical protein F5Y19DRAFT_443171 [Xylariaceae sp. FL1651]|nr:hypothetical protein F5Y19DRAFT_443171 [Xylariaceae sp. FL1651]
MENKYTITINNNTGSPQNYNLFTEKPEVTGVVKSSIWTNIYQTAPSTPPDAQAYFEMWKQYYAIVGTWKGGQRAGAKVSIFQTKPVTLGSKGDDDTITPGTTLNLTVLNNTTPSFDKTPAQSTAWNNAYEVDTGNDFTKDVATDNNFFVGLASSPDGTSSVPTATFQPEPGNQYQVQPANIFYIDHGSTFAVGELLDVAKLSKQPLGVDYTVLNKDVVINHTAEGKLVIAK